MVYKTARRYVKKAARYVKKRYFKGRGYGKPKLAKMYADVKAIKTLVNVEKKRYNVQQNSQTVGQLSINAVGLFCGDVTPIPAQGVAYNQRTGASMKIVSAFLEFQFWTMSANTHRTRLVLEVFRIKGAPTTASAFYQSHWLVNPASGIVDYNSDVNPDNYGTATCIYRRKFNIIHNYSSEVAIKDMNCPQKFNHHVRFSQNSTTVTDGQLIMAIRADSGNVSGTISTATNVPILTASSGINFNYDYTFYYVDN